MHQPTTLQAQSRPELEIIDQLNTVLGTASAEHLLWISGYCYGLAQGKATNPEAINNPEAQQQIWIVYGSQTGNARTIAETLAQGMRDNQRTVTLKSMSELQARKLKNCDLLFAVVSTQGEGEPPEEALAFFEGLNSNRAPDLSHLNFTILGLGDSSYEYFCETAKQFDQRLEELGANRLFPRIDADIDFQKESPLWIEKLLQHVEEILPTSQNNAIDKPELKLVSVATTISKTNPFTAELLTNQQITGKSSTKSIHHLEIDISDSGIVYQPGDSLGILVSNSEQQIEQIIKAGQLDKSAIVQINDEGKSFGDALANELEITRLHPKVFQKYATNNSLLEQRLATGGRKALLKFSNSYQLIDLLKEFPENLTEQQLVDILQPKVERLYSISSSLDAHPDEVHLTVAAVEYQRNNAMRFGTGSIYLNQSQLGGDLRVYLQENSHFRLPEDSDTPIIMVGPGTGVAPFRSFIQQRQLHGGSGKNWLFFGNPHFHSDFLYQLEWQKSLKNGTLNRMDLAFSRDQPDKIYVQDRINENARDIYDWLEQGAVFYICGDASQMAKAVENSLLNVITTQSNKNLDFAKEYLSQMKTQKRFLKDVY